MYIRVKTQGGSRAFVLVESVREGKKVRQKFICHLGSFPVDHDLKTYDFAYSCFLQKMHREVGLLNLPPIHKKNLYSKISDKLRQVRKQVRHEAKGRL